MLSREEILKEVLDIDRKNILLELSTGVGKTRLALEIVDKYNPESILVVVPRVVLKQNWKDEFIKWNKEKYLNKTVFSTYAGIHKVVGKFDAVIYDECHHITPRVQEIIMSGVNSKRNILLSATVGRNLKLEFKSLFPELYTYKVGLKEAICNSILPDPTVYLIPLSLDKSSISEIVIKHPKGRKSMHFRYNEKWRKYLADADIKLSIMCTQVQKNMEFDREVDYWKNRYMRTRIESFKNTWLHTAGERLKWLANSKNNVIRDILSYLSNERVLTFCNSIEQTEIVCPNCINSKNSRALELLESFNAGRINHISACGMLNEGTNLSSCRIGVFANLNSSEILQTQRNGRILRHPKPVIIIPYYKGTREEELKNKMLENYNETLVKTIYNINEIEL